MYTALLNTTYGQIKDQNGWKNRINNELQVICRNPNAATTIKVRILERAGHGRTSDDRTIQKVLLGKPDGREKSRKTKIKVGRLYCEWYEINSCQRYGGRRQKTDLHGLSFWRRHWLNCKDRMPTMEEEEERKKAEEEKKCILLFQAPPNWEWANEHTQLLHP